ncbi:MAG TPA: GNAT family N-acetyltransferase [Candidatus Tectomicrobia bacterium]|nr:GNAT family N-acetyltransferase [Candidatus Tectomicrobia bacterium]
MAAWRARQHWVPVSYLRDEIEPVEQCVVGLVDDQVAALIWVYPAPASSRFFVLRPGDVELNHGFVLNQFRRRGFFTDVLRYASMWCLEAGARRVFAAVDEKNSPSLHGFRGAGFRDFARIRHVLLWRPRFRTPG